MKENIGLYWKIPSMNERKTFQHGISTTGHMNPIVLLDDILASSSRNGQLKISSFLSPKLDFKGFPPASRNILREFPENIEIKSEQTEISSGIASIDFGELQKFEKYEYPIASDGKFDPQAFSSFGKRKRKQLELVHDEWQIPPSGRIMQDAAQEKPDASKGSVKSAEHLVEASQINSPRKPKKSSDPVMKFQQIKQKLENKRTKTFECDYCTRRLCSKQALINHINTKHLQDIVTYYCLYCDDFKSNSNDELKSHMSKKHEINSYKCDYCKKNFPIKEFMESHMKKFHMVAQQICDICRIIFENDAALSTHKNKYHAIKSIKCDVSGCEESFVSETYFQRHKSKHSDAFECNFSCNECNQKFPTNQTLNYHMDALNHSKRHKCPMCSRSFLHRYKLLGHCRIYHGYHAE